MKRDLALVLTYVLIGVAVGITLEASGSLVWLDRLVAQKIQKGGGPDARKAVADEGSGDR